MGHMTLFTDILPEEQERMRVCFKAREAVFQNGETVMEYSSAMKKIGLILDDPNYSHPLLQNLQSLLPYRSHHSLFCCVYTHTFHYPK